MFPVGGAEVASSVVVDEHDRRAADREEVENGK